MLASCQLSCEAREINEASYFFARLCIIIAVILRYDCDGIAIQSKAMARKSDYIDGIWILAQSSASITHLFNLIKDFISEVNLKNF
jgi:hypothetical protein